MRGPGCQHRPGYTRISNAPNKEAPARGGLAGVSTKEVSMNDHRSRLPRIMLILTIKI
jgi:hypothetical protein